MERFCSFIGNSVKSRQYPYANIDQRVLSRAHLQVILRKFSLLGKPPFTNKKPTIKEAINILPNLQVTNGGDLIHARGYHKLRSDGRDAAFIRYELLVDLDDSEPDLPENLERQSQYGELQHVFALPIKCRTPKVNPSRHDRILLLALVLEAKVNIENNGENEVMWYNGKLGSGEVVDLTTVQCTVGRVRDRNGKRWWIVDRNVGNKFTYPEFTCGRKDPEVPYPPAPNPPWTRSSGVDTGTHSWVRNSQQSSCPPIDHNTRNFWKPDPFSKSSGLSGGTVKCIIPALEGLLLSSIEQQVLTLLFVLAYWHGLAKLRRHSTATVTMDPKSSQVTTRLGHKLRKFHRYTFEFEIYETTKERTAHEQRMRKKARPRAALAAETEAPDPTPDISCQLQGRRRKYFNLETVKFHALMGNPDSIECMGTTDSTSTQTGELLHCHSVDSAEQTGMRLNLSILLMSSELCTSFRDFLVIKQLIILSRWTPLLQTIVSWVIGDITTFVDRDMLMRFNGMAIGHMAHGCVLDFTTGLPVEILDTSKWWEDEIGVERDDEGESEGDASDVGQLEAYISESDDDEMTGNPDEDVSW
ncbi:hypothetical protein CTheo_8725 [Ceratobasidium theobromae]|uniref:Uncharacterized protein n=1 Tax=Ceratobasidium theobromae TaxID=1582974 RepID=A0A5N5Q8K4_9AGAM|nr:hypothetical protein CTheo_8725 [Ceratobasidium theobromae]